MIYLRADGDKSIGLGHLYRMSALKECLSAAGMSATFLSRSAWNPAFCGPEDWRSIPADCEEASEPKFVARMMGPAATVVLDGYAFREDYQACLLEADCTVVSIDDFRHCGYRSDFVLSHVGGVSPHDFEAAPHTVFFLGTQYALIRPLFCPGPPQSPPGKRLLICLGGADPQNITQEALLSLAPGLYDRVDVVLGAANPHTLEIQDRVARLSFRVEIHVALSPQEMLEVYRSCSHAILPPSTVAYEYLSAGGGALGLLQTADNQAYIRRFLLERGSACLWNELGDLKTEEVDQMRDAQQNLFDGKSPQRLQEIFLSIRQVGAMPFAMTEAPATQLLPILNAPLPEPTHFYSLGQRLWSAVHTHEKDTEVWLRHNFESDTVLAVAIGRTLKARPACQAGRLRLYVEKGDAKMKAALRHLRLKESDALTDSRLQTYELRTK